MLKEVLIFEDMVVFAWYTGDAIDTKLVSRRVNSSKCVSYSIKQATVSSRLRPPS